MGLGSYHDEARAALAGFLQQAATQEACLYGALLPEEHCTVPGTVPYGLRTFQRTAFNLKFGSTLETPFLIWKLEQFRVPRNTK